MSGLEFTFRMAAVTVRVIMTVGHKIDDKLKQTFEEEEEPYAVKRTLECQNPHYDRFP